jgi:hypothetical protein
MSDVPRPARTEDLSPVRRAWLKAASRIPFEVRGSARLLKRVLVDHGYFRSAREQVPIDRGGHPVPWYTFPAVEYLEQLDFKGRKVFEYGSGNSTLWWLAKGANVASVENDRDWYERLRPQVEGPQMTYQFATDRDAYIDAVMADAPFDVIVVDGFWRGKCALRALECLGDGGLLILDNSDWLPDVAADLRAAGLLQVDFHGFIPLGDHSSTTSLFFRRDADFRPTANQPAPPRGGVGIPEWRRRFFLEDPGASP